MAVNSWPMLGRAGLVESTPRRAQRRFASPTGDVGPAREAEQAFCAKLGGGMDVHYTAPNCIAGAGGCKIFPWVLLRASRVQFGVSFEQFDIPKTAAGHGGRFRRLFCTWRRVVA